MRAGGGQDIDSFRTAEEGKLALQTGARQNGATGLPPLGTAVRRTWVRAMGRPEACSRTTP